MTSLLITLCALFIIAIVYFYLNYQKKKVFDNYIVLSAALDFTQNKNIKTKGNYGLILFNIAEIKKESRALYIENVKISNSGVSLRSYNNIYTKLPISPEGVTLSIGVRRSRNIKQKDLSKCSVTISGFLMEDKNKKLAFRKKLPIEYLTNPTNGVGAL